MYPKNNHCQDHPFSQLITREHKALIKEYTQGPPHQQILRSTGKAQISITVSDLRELIAPTSPINQELLTLGLENACPIFQGSYLEPAFFPILQHNGWPGVINWFVNQHQTSSNRPYNHHPNLSIPVHIGGNHWVAVCRRTVSSVTSFYYADDLNDDSIEKTIKDLLFVNAHQYFCPPGSRCVPCENTTYRSHSNECGPRTLLALSVMMSHPQPHDKMLAPYMNPNLAQQARAWMGSCLLTGTLQLLPPVMESVTTRCVIQRSAQSSPCQFISWDIPVTNLVLTHPSTSTNNGRQLRLDTTINPTSKRLKTKHRNRFSRGLNEKKAADTKPCTPSLVKNKGSSSEQHSTKQIYHQTTLLPDNKNNSQPSDQWSMGSLPNTD